VFLELAAATEGFAQVRAHFGRFDAGRRRVSRLPKPLLSGDPRDNYRAGQ